MQHTVAVVQSTADNSNSHSFGCVRCQKWPYMAHCTDLQKSSINTNRKHRRRSGWNSGERMARTKGGSVPSGVGYGGYPLFSRLGGLGEHRELPQRGPGRSPAKNGFWRILKATERSFCTNMTKSEENNLHYRPLLQILGDVSPRPLMIYAHDRKSTTLFSINLKWTSYVATKPPKGLKNAHISD